MYINRHLFHFVTLYTLVGAAVNIPRCASVSFYLVADDVVALSISLTLSLLLILKDRMWVRILSGVYMSLTGIMITMWFYSEFINRGGISGYVIFLSILAGFFIISGALLGFSREKA